MKNIKTLTPGFALSAALLSAAAAPQAVFAHGAKGQHVTVTVDGSGYHPSTVSVKAGQPVHLTFVSRGAGCANGISIPALKKTFKLKPGQKQEVVFTPKKGQAIGFVCSMNMLKGKVVTK